MYHKNMHCVHYTQHKNINLLNEEHYKRIPYYSRIGLVLSIIAFIVTTFTVY